MTKWDLLLLIFIYFAHYLMDFVQCSLLQNNLDDKSHYDDDYGTKWIYFPDGDGVLHYINLTISEDDTPIIRNSMFDAIEFKLYLRNDTESYILLDRWGRPVDEDNQNITTDILFSNIPLKIITHGWRSSVDKEGVLNIKNAYLEAKGVNVITVDWSYTASSIFYHWVANETKAIGAKIAFFLDGLNYMYNVTGKQIHLIGHSLGAHVMGIAASRTNNTVYRVTGLDPARPFFEYPPQDEFAKLDSSDAEFVDVIHTCGGLLGFEAAIGTADFYPNKGVAPQPGCDDIVKIFEACSHGRSFYYFTESIKYPKSFPAYQCQTWVDFLENRCSHYGYMGEGVNRNMTGKYYLTTNAFEPFGGLWRHLSRHELQRIHQWRYVSYIAISKFTARCKHIQKPNINCWVVARQTKHPSARMILPFLLHTLFLHA